MHSSIARRLGYHLVYMYNCILMYHYVILFSDHFHLYLKPNNVFNLIDVMSNDTAAEGSVRLVGGDTLLEGRVEVFLLGQWGTVCDYNWDLADATVVCHELGYVRAVEAPRSAFFGAGSGPSWYSYVYCTGTELNLNQCSRSTSYFGSACSNSNDAGVVCSSESQSTPAAMCYACMLQYIYVVWIARFCWHVTENISEIILISRFVVGFATWLWHP